MPDNEKNNQITQSIGCDYWVNFLSASEGSLHDVFERRIAELAPDATFAAFQESVQNGGAVVVEGNQIVRVTPSGTEVLQSIESPFSSRKNIPGTRMKFG